MNQKTQLSQDLFDVAVIGGGPAGLSATLWLGRYLRRVVLIDAGDPRNWETRGVHGLLGHTHIRPAQLRRRGRRQCRQVGATLVDGHIDWVESLDTGHFELRTEENGHLRARRVLICTGIRDNWPEIPGLERCYGMTVHTCPHCDGYEARDATTAVIGWGPKAVDVAFALKTWTDKIIICTHGHAAQFEEEQFQRLDDEGIPLYGSRIERLEERHRHLRKIDFDDGRVMECAHLFIAMGQHPADDIGTQFGLERDEIGRIIIDHNHRTSVPNVYAAGDITPGVQLVSLASAEGVRAAQEIHRSLKS